MGSAMAAATVCGLYPTIEDAQKSMGSGFEKEYQPRSENAVKYQKLYNKYSILGEFVEKQTQKEP